jgi:MFS family permease
MTRIDLPRAAAAPPAAAGAPGTPALLFVGLGALAVSLSQSVLVPVLAILPARLNATTTSVSWLLTSTLLVATASVPVMGRLGDMFGKRLILLYAIGALTLGSLVTATSDNIGILVLGRAIQGLSAAAIPMGISLLSVVMPRERVTSSIAMVSAMLGVGGALGLPLAGFVAEHADFHLLFWISAALGALAFTGIALVVPEADRRAGASLDVVGSLLLATGLVCLVLPLSQGAEWGWGSLRVLALLAASAITFVVFTWTQSRARHPLVNMNALRSRPILLVNVASVCFGFALFASFIGSASYVESPSASGYGFGSSPLVGGLVLLPSGLAMMILAPIAAKMIDRRGSPQTLAVGATVIALGWLGRIVFTEHLWQVFVLTTVVGIGTGIGYAAIPSIINAHTDPREVASANGLNTLFRSLGSSLASAVGGSLLAGSTVVLGDIRLPSFDAYRVLFVLCAAAALAAAGCVLALRELVPDPR